MIKPSPWGQAIGEGLSKNMATSLGGAVASSVTGGIREEISDKTTDYVDKKVFMPFDSWRKKRQDQKGKDFQVKNPDVGDLD
ncbi:MAG: hypothetical protein US85_C0005G0030 [Candidatus Shapirobacteria bacterium GW2011_GWF1_38_23]|nr:MAG: hypothetical protein US85_C0005G0030 [Candidatus Shapirobacteria bacterium GW2011_GWF1_38_23]